MAHLCRFCSLAESFKPSAEKDEKGKSIANVRCKAVFYLPRARHVTGNELSGEDNWQMFLR